MKSLWEDVVESGYSNIDSIGSDMDAATEAAIDSAISDDPVDVTSYVGECLTGMVAIEGALATIEGRCAVDYLRATTESAKAEVTATMEGAVSDAWETFKRYVKKAYAAIKKFLQKVWNKIKAKAATIKAMITKYEKVLRDFKGNVTISWAKFEFENLVRTRDAIMNQLKSAYETAKTKVTKDGDLRAADQQGNLAYNVDSNSELKKALWGNENGPEYKDAKWADKKAEALAVADGSVEKIINDYQLLGEKNEREAMQLLKEAEGDANDKMDDSKGISKNKQATLRNFLRAQIKVNNQCATLLSSGATAYRNQCVAACRKAIASMHKVKEGYTPSTESTSDFDAIMAQMI